MKRLICILLSVLIMSGASFAQDKAPKAAAPKEAKAGKMKKDGTPDMRHKENKDAAAAAQPAAGKTKKDGTPDMRYKENKEKKEEKPAGKMKKDGTPDMRTKENKEAAKKK